MNDETAQRKERGQEGKEQHATLAGKITKEDASSGDKKVECIF